MSFVLKILTYLFNGFLSLSWHERVGLVWLMIWCALITFYMLYLAAINVWENRSGVQWWVLVLCAPLLAAMVIVDTLMNWTIFTALMIDPPREAFVTTRMKRYRALTVPCWRQRVANTICTKLLNPFDPTKHHC